MREDNTMSKSDRAPEREPWQSCNFMCGECEKIPECRFAHWSMNRELTELSQNGEGSTGSLDKKPDSDLGRLLDELGTSVGVASNDFSNVRITSDITGQPLFAEAKQLAVQAHQFWTDSSDSPQITVIEPLLMELAWHAALIPARAVELTQLLAQQTGVSAEMIVSLTEDMLDVLDSCLAAINGLEELDEEVGCGPALDMIVGKIAWLRVELLRLRHRYGGT